MYTCVRWAMPHRKLHVCSHILGKTPLEKRIPKSPSGNNPNPEVNLMMLTPTIWLSHNCGPNPNPFFWRSYSHFFSPGGFFLGVPVSSRDFSWGFFHGNFFYWSNCFWCGFSQKGFSMGLFKEAIHISGMDFCQDGFFFLGRFFHIVNHSQYLLISMGHCGS